MLVFIYSLFRADERTMEEITVNVGIECVIFCKIPPHIFYIFTIGRIISTHKPWLRLLRALILP
jgi:hypothetical protein